MFIAGDGSFPPCYCYTIGIAGDGSFLHAIFMDIVLARDVLPLGLFDVLRFWLEMFYLYAFVMIVLAG